MKILDIRKDMMTALKNGESEKKITLSLLLSALELKEKEKKSPLTDDEMFAVIRKELKQTNETLESAPSDRIDIINQCKKRIAVIESYLPKLMDEDEIKEAIDSVLLELGIEKIVMSDKGRIMKILMPKVKGKADGKLVNSILESYLK